MFQCCGASPTTPDLPMVTKFRSSDNPHSPPGYPDPLLASKHQTNTVPDDTRLYPTVDKRSRRVRPKRPGRPKAVENKPKKCVTALLDHGATTSATFEACAQVLLSRGTREVRVLRAAAAPPAARRRPQQHRPENAHRPLATSLGSRPGARSCLGRRLGAHDLVRSGLAP